jgi:hypothetical protein
MRSSKVLSASSGGFQSRRNATIVWATFTRIKRLRHFIPYFVRRELGEAGASGSSTTTV